MFETFLADQPNTPLLSRVVSRKTDGSAGTFDINMPIPGAAGVEDRVASSVGSHTLVFTFTSRLTNGTATSSSGTVSGVTFGGNDMIVNLTNITDLRTATVTAHNVTGPNGTLASISVNATFLIGDVTGDRTVNGGDTTVAQTAPAPPSTLTTSARTCRQMGSSTPATPRLSARNRGTPLPLSAPQGSNACTRR